MKKQYPVVGLLAALTINNSYAINLSSTDFWQVSSSELSQQARNSQAKNSKHFVLELAQLRAALSENNTVTLTLPLPTGEMVAFQLTPSSVMASALAEKYPNIRTFSGHQVGKPAHYGQFDITPHGFHGVFNYQGDKVYIDPVSRNSDLHYQSYFQSDAKPLSTAALGKRLAPKVRHYKATHKEKTIQSNTATKQQHITYRIAVATTAEYSEFHGGSKEKSLAAVVTMLNRVNQVYQQDLAVTLQLVANNDKLIFTDPNSDPFNNTDEDIDVITQVINDAIGVESYDVGHIVGTGGGGLAGLGVVCGDYKAEGLTGSSEPTNDAFHIDYVAHEIGHQFGADHTFNGEVEGCQGNRETNSAYEPGSAATIMGYAGLCGEQNLQFNSDAHFHIHSIDQMRAYTQQGEGNSCGIKTDLVNQAPVVDAGRDYTIPSSTPFTLVGSATDQENDQLSYSWQQFDLGAATTSKTDDLTDDGKKPLFRTFLPTDSPVRTLPKMSDVLANKASYGEAMATTTRELNFRLVVRDNQGNVADDKVTLSVVKSEQAFAVTQPSTWQSMKEIITWDTANTEQAPVSCAYVDIALSTDSGKTFTTLAQKTENDGREELTVAALETDKARIKINCHDNIFFAVNQRDFSINNKTDVAPVKPEFKSQQALTMAEDTQLTISAQDLSFNGGQTVDSLAIKAGDNYQFDGLKITPIANFNGQLNVKMTAQKGQLLSDEFSVKITVTAVNDAPVAQDDSVTVEQDAAAKLIDVLTNDSDIDDSQLTLKSVAYEGKGSVVISDNQLKYQAATGFSGSETITYIVTDAQGAQASAKVIVTVTAKATPTPEPEATKESSGGSVFYLLGLALLSMRRVMGKGSFHG